jgi:hypothetical protein
MIPNAMVNKDDSNHNIGRNNPDKGIQETKGYTLSIPMRLMRLRSR